MKLDYSYAPLIMAQLINVPYLIIYLVGIFLSARFRQRHPRIFLLTLIAFICFLSESLLYAVTQYQLHSMIRIHKSMDGLGIFQILDSVLGGLLTFVGWILLLIALFSSRSARRPEVHMPETPV